VTLIPCPVCRTPSDPRILALTEQIDATVAALVAQQHPGWRAAHGICPGCLQRFSSRLAAQRSLESLHTLTNPSTTFPYYHPAEETVLSQVQRLPDYAACDGSGVTIAFLDSGYFPHPDFLRDAAWHGAQPEWRLLSAQQWHDLLRGANLRLLDYVDLTDDGEQVGLDVPSLWDSAGDSWHGQMTTAIAAGNGLLSGGRYRGYAPGASILPIKIGRGGGRIPEEDILRGLNWLLRDDNWQRYGVRVVNISVGGDYPEAWQDNPVSRAAHALAQRGVFVAAAAGNRGTEELLAPAQTPTVLTVGGVDDRNLHWHSTAPEDRATMELYHHNYGSVPWQHTLLRKPELLALARWVPAPILPPSPVLRETYMIARLRHVLQGEDERTMQRLLLHWQRALHAQADTPSWQEQDDPLAEEMMPEVWHALRRRMNAHKWVHPYYQHVDGTSVSVAQVSAVAAQMFAANPRLNGDEVRRLLVETSLPLPHLLPRQTGAGLLQPAQAVAAALRARGGSLGGYPQSSVRLRDHELQKLAAQGTLAVLSLAETPNAAGVVYFGCYAPDAACVSLIGSFNHWLPHRLPLQAAGSGWWHAAVQLPPGAHLYRFWIEDARAAAGTTHEPTGSGFWRRDYENPNCSESGYHEGHSVIVI
jgi:serine protease AprX